MGSIKAENRTKEDTTTIIIYENGEFVSPVEDAPVTVVAPKEGETAVAAHDHEREAGAEEQFGVPESAGAAEGEQYCEGDFGRQPEERRKAHWKERGELGQLLHQDAGQEEFRDGECAGLPTGRQLALHRGVARHEGRTRLPLQIECLLTKRAKNTSA